MLVLFAIFGSLSGLLFLALPTGSSITPILAALLTITGNIGYAVGTVCSNAFLPELAREVNGANGDNQGGAEAEPLLEETAGGDVTDGRPQGPVTRLTQAVVHGAAGAHPQTEELPPASAPIEPSAIAADIIDKTTRSDLSFITSRLSSTCTALGFFSGVTVLALLLVPVTLMGGSTFSLRLAVGISGAWWITFLVPAALGLPGSTIEDSVTMPSVKEGWRRVGRMVRIQEMKRLQNLFKFLLCWIFLSDGTSMLVQTHDRLPHYHIYCHLIRIFPTTHVGDQGRYCWHSGAIDCCRVVHPRTESATAYELAESATTSTGDDRWRGSAAVCVFGVVVALWRPAERGGDVHRGGMVWHRTSLVPVQVHSLTDSYLARSIAIPEQSTQS